MSLESSIAPHLRRPDRTPKHPVGTYTPPYPSFSARFGEEVGAVVMAYFGVQSREASDPSALDARVSLREMLAATDGPGHVDRTAYVDAYGYNTVIDIAYWDDLGTYERWERAHLTAWLADADVVSGIGRFLELVTPSADRFETIFSAPEPPEGVSLLAEGMSGMIEEHGYWGSMRDRLPAAQADPLYPDGEPIVEVSGSTRTVRLHRNACLIRSGQDYGETDEEQREIYLSSVEPPLHEGMDYLRDHGNSIGCFDNRYMVVLDENDQPTERTFGVSWWRDLSALEDWSASHGTHVKIFGAAMRYLSTFGPAAQLKLYHEVTVPTEHEQRFVYVGCHDNTGLLKALAT